MSIGDIIYKVAKLESTVSVIKTSPLQVYKLYRDYKCAKEDAYYRSTGIEDIDGNKDWYEAEWVA